MHTADRDFCYVAKICERMCITHVLYVHLIVVDVVVVLFSVCQDLVEEIICIEEKAGGNCDEYPWNAKCRKTCGRCGKFKTNNL